MMLKHWLAFGIELPILSSPELLRTKHGFRQETLCVAVGSRLGVPLLCPAWPRVNLGSGASAGQGQAQNRRHRNVQVGNSILRQTKPETKQKPVSEGEGNPAKGLQGRFEAPNARRTDGRTDRGCWCPEEGEQGQVAASSPGLGCQDTWGRARSCTGGGSGWAPGEISLLGGAMGFAGQRLMPVRVTALWRHLDSALMRCFNGHFSLRRPLKASGHSQCKCPALQAHRGRVPLRPEAPRGAPAPPQPQGVPGSRLPSASPQGGAHRKGRGLNSRGVA